MQATLRLTRAAVVAAATAYGLNACVLLAVRVQRSYRRIAEALTRTENHHYESSAHDALVLKRFMFEACNAFVALFYVAFVEMDIIATRAILISLCVPPACCHAASAVCAVVRAPSLMPAV